MHKLFFWHNWHASDLTLARPLVRRILSEHDVQITWGCLKNQAYIVEDLPVNLAIDHRNDPLEGLIRPDLTYLCPPDHLPIYLWVGKYTDTKFHLWEAVVELYNRQIREHGLAHLRISDNFVPMVDFPSIEVAIADNSVFIENGIARSMHSDFEFDIPALASEFPDLNFYCTANPHCEATNVADCSQCNLRELSSISNRCIAIAGKGSGPFCSTLTEVNRYKPRALMRYHPSGTENTIWDYPGNPMQYLETDEELRQFLKKAQRRKQLYLLPGKPMRIANPDAPIVPADSEAARIGHLIQQYARHPEDPEYIDAMLNARDRIVRLWLAIPESELEYAYRGAWGKIHRQLMKLHVRSLRPSKLIESPFLPVDPNFSDETTSIYSTDKLRYILAAMLVISPPAFPSFLNFRQIPNWLRSDCLTYIQQTPGFFVNIGEAARYFRFQEHTLITFADCLNNEPTRPHHRYLSLGWIEREQRQRFLLTDAPMKASQLAHGTIIEKLFLSMNFDMEYTFPERLAGRKPRIGVLANHFGPSAETYATLPLFEYLGSDFDVTLYAAELRSQPLEEYCRSRAAMLRVLPREFDEQIAIIRKDNLDILISAFSFADESPLIWINKCRLARRQIAANSPVTSGLSTVDGFLSGSLVDRDVDLTASYSEQVLSLDGSGLCWSYGNHVPVSLSVIDAASVALPSDALVFVSLACMLDITPELVAAWAMILAKVPNAFLMLMPFDPCRCANYDEHAFFESVRSTLLEHHVDPNRLRMLSPASFPIYDELTSYLGLADLYLDSFPVASPALVLAALRLGIPVITRRGIERRSTLSAAIIEELSPSLAQKLVGASIDDYIQTAIELGLDENSRRAFSAQILQAMPTAPFLNSQLFSNRLAAQLRRIIHYG